MKDKEGGIQVVKILWEVGNEMGSKPNAAQITEALAKLGGGSIAEGGGGMLQGMKNIFETGINYGINQQNQLESPSEILQIEDKEKEVDGNVNQTV